MAEIKRINLCFDISREEDKRVYNILKEQRHKTNFVIDLIFKDNVDKPEKISKELVKEALVEALKEIDLDLVERKNSTASVEEDIPEDIFEIINSI